MPDGYDTAQICVNGHTITSGYDSFPKYRKSFCDECGAKTIHQCAACATNIRGYVKGSLSVQPYMVPKYCGDCGEPYPWTLARIEAISELIDLAPGLSDRDKLLVKQCLPDLANSTPHSEVSILKVKKLLVNSKDFGKKILEKLVVDLATEQSKALLLAAMKDWTP